MKCLTTVESEIPVICKAAQQLEGHALEPECDTGKFCNFLCLVFLICKRGTIIPTSQACEYQMS